MYRCPRSLHSKDRRGKYYTPSITPPIDFTSLPYVSTQGRPLFTGGFYPSQSYLCPTSASTPPSPVCTSSQTPFLRPCPLTEGIHHVSPSASPTSVSPTVRLTTRCSGVEFYGQRTDRRGEGGPSGVGVSQQTFVGRKCLDRQASTVPRETEESCRQAEEQKGKGCPTYVKRRRHVRLYGA